jgi:succinate dehydrogenase / fumarate reductase cytochrome b subunit
MEEFSLNVMKMCASSNKRPTYLRLWEFQWPVTALASIAHRVSGVALALSLPFSVYILDPSLRSPESFAALSCCWMVKTIFFLLSLAMFYHLVSGIRHLLMDHHYFEELSSGETSALIVIAVSAFYFGFLLVRYWF